MPIVVSFNPVLAAGALAMQNKKIADDQANSQLSMQIASLQTQADLRREEMDQQQIRFQQQLHSANQQASMDDSARRQQLAALQEEQRRRGVLSMQEAQAGENFRRDSLNASVAEADQARQDRQDQTESILHDERMQSDEAAARLADQERNAMAAAPVQDPKYAGLNYVQQKGMAILDEGLRNKTIDAFTHMRGSLAILSNATDPLKPYGEGGVGADRRQDATQDYGEWKVGVDFDIQKLRQRVDAAKLVLSKLNKYSPEEKLTAAQKELHDAEVARDNYRIPDRPTRQPQAQTASPASVSGSSTRPSISKGKVTMNAQKPLTKDVITALLDEIRADSEPTQEQTNEVFRLAHERGYLF